MADGLKGLRQVLAGEVQRAVVTSADLDARSAVVLDATVAKAAGFVEHEKVEVANHSSGARFAAVLALAKADSGALRVDGPGAHLVRPGEAVTLTTWVAMKDKPASKHRPRLVVVDGHNVVLNVTGGPELTVSKVKEGVAPKKAKRTKEEKPR